MSKIFHGGRLDTAIAQYGGSREDWLDLSTGINPNPYPLPEIEFDSWHRLPDENAQSDLIKSARRYYKIPEEMAIAASNGTQAIIQNLPSTLSGKKIAILAPTYEEHQHCWVNAGREVIKTDDLEVAIELADIIVVVNPNNPTGKQYQSQVLLNVAIALQKKSGFLIVDEAFGDCMPELSVVPNMQNNVIVLRSFGKFFGLAGLRLGFVIGAGSIVDQLNNKLGPWSVSGPALAIGREALANTNWTIGMRLQIAQNSKDQAEVIEACGLKLIGNGGLFMEFEHSRAGELHEALLKEHILVRPFLKRDTRLRFGLCKNMEELERLALTIQKTALKNNA